MPPRQLTPGEPVTVSVSIDHGQFLVEDRDSQIDTSSYTPEAFQRGLASWPGGVAVFGDAQWTESTRVTVTLEEADPGIDEAAFDRVTRTELSCLSGELRIYAPEGTGVEEAALRLPPGDYFLLVCRERTSPADEYGEFPDDTYELWLWPSEGS